MASASDAAAALTPGSLPYGERGQLEQNMVSAMAGGGPAAASSAPVAPPGASAVGTDDPFGALLNGDVTIESEDGFLTDGLSVGPGRTPGPPSALVGDRADKLRQLATEAASPMIRAAARQELRRMARREV